MVEAITTGGKLSVMGPLANPHFLKLFTAQIVALVGTGLSTVALTLLAYNLAGGNAAAILGTAFAFKMIAYVVFAPIVGGLAHRLPRKPFLIITDLFRAGVLLALPFVDSLWQVYLFIFLINFCSAGFKPVFSAIIPELLPEQKQYTQALSLSRMAYDLENLLSPLLAGLALMVMTYNGLFVANAVAFLISALLIILTTLPEGERIDRSGKIWSEISFGVRSYLKTPRLRGLLVLYVAVSCASAMIIVNTVVYVRATLGGTEADVALALAASGFGSMTAALILPLVLKRILERSVMLFGGGLMAISIGMIAISPGFPMVLVTWFIIGFGLSLVQTPTGRVVNRSSGPSDRTSYFSAHFALSHACWLFLYPISGFLGANYGIENMAILFSVSILILSVLASRIWPKEDTEELEHLHEAVSHQHLHIHDSHHHHEHEGWEGPEPHSHMHSHKEVRHKHKFVIDSHHTVWPQS